MSSPSESPLRLTDKPKSNCPCLYCCGLLIAKLMTLRTGILLGCIFANIVTALAGAEADYWVENLDVTNNTQHWHSYDVAVLKRLPDWARFIDGSDTSLATWEGYYGSLYSVDDPEGTVNVRKEASLDSPVIAQIPSGSLVTSRVYTEEQTDQHKVGGGDWIRVAWQPVSGEPDLTGFIHASRLAPLDKWKKFRAHLPGRRPDDKSNNEEPDASGRIVASIPVEPGFVINLDLPFGEQNGLDGKASMTIERNGRRVAVPSALLKNLTALPRDLLLKSIDTVDVFTHPELPITVLGVDLPGCCCGHSKIFWTVADDKVMSPVSVYFGI